MVCVKKKQIKIIFIVLITYINYIILDRVKIVGEQLGTEHLVTKNSSNRGFHIEVNLKNITNFDVKHPPTICKYVS